MSAIRFLQIHTLHSYTAALLNRDDNGLAKRLPYGDSVRTRISSQCLKRHWRMAADDPHALQRLGGFVDSARSRELVTKKVFEPLKGKYPEDVLDTLKTWFQFVVYSGNPKDKPKKIGSLSKADDKKLRPTLLFGEPELQWLADEFEALASKSTGDAKQAFILGENWADAFKDNIKALRATTTLPGGIAAALFGRMVTSDPAANIEAPVHVAHAFTVHAEATEPDYFTAVDDLRGEDDDSGADTIQETELTSGLFYGYVVIDLPGLIENCGGDRELAAQIVHHLMYLIAEVSPGAKLGSTAPYGRADLVLAETGDRQPRSLAGAYRQALANDPARAVVALAAHLQKMDAAYATGETRRCTALDPTEIPSTEQVPLPALADWAAAQTRAATP